MKNYVQILQSQREVSYSDKDRKFWNYNGRDVGEIRINDILEVDGEVNVIEGIENFYVYTDKETFEKEDFDATKRLMKIICFAENQEDFRVY